MCLHRFAPFMCLLAVLAAGVCRANGADSSPAVTILTFAGQAEVSRRDGVWDPAHTNQVLLVGDKMRTGKKSRATLRLSDGTTMTIGAEASFLVPESKKGVTLNPLKGLFYFFHRDKPGDFELRSRTAAAAVRGTEFHLEADEDGVWLLSVLDGDVLLQTDAGALDLKTGQAAQAKPGLKPQPVVMREATDLIQWCFYYPAVLDADELALPASEQDELRASLTAYRAGDLRAALEQCAFEQPTCSDMAAIYRAQLLLAVGQVSPAEQMLAGVSASGPTAIRVRSLKAAIMELIAVVKGQPRRTGAPETASAWLAESYRLQAESNLPAALAAAREVVRISPDFGLGWERVAELEFSFGHTGKAQSALEKSLVLAPRNPLAVSLKGFLAAADSQLTEAMMHFETAIALDGAHGNAWLGRGLCRIRSGEMAAGRQDLLVAASLEPQRSAFRSYLGKAFAMGHNPARARQELELAQRLDSKDPTSWLYSALLLLEENRVNAAIAALEKSAALNDHRSLFRSRLLLDQDRAVRGANLASVYQDAGMDEVAVREATKAVEADYANYSAHQFLANSFNGLRDPQQINLRYETAWLSEYLMANLLAPVGTGTLSPMVSQQEYSRLFEQNGVGLVSATEYASRGDWVQSAVQHGEFGHTGYALEETYRSQNGERPNHDQEQLTLSFRLKHDFTPHDSLYFQLIHYDAEAGDLAQYYDPTFANPTLRVRERQEPLLLVGYHHEWSPGIHTLALAGRLQDTVELTNASAGTLFFRARRGVKQFGSLAVYEQSYASDQEIYIAELQQLFRWADHTLVIGGRYQTGVFEAASLIQNGATFPGGTPTGINPILQNQRNDFERCGFYAYEQWRPVDSLLLIGGVAGDWMTYPDNYLFAPLANSEADRDSISPKAGLVWTPTAGTTLRAAYSRALGGVSFDQSFRLEPAQVAGINQAFRSLVPEAVVGSLAAPEFEIYGLQIEQRFRTRTYLGIALGLLLADGERTVGAVEFDPIPLVPTPNPYRPTSISQTLDYQEHTLTATLHQLLGRDFALGAVYQVSRANLATAYPDVPTGLILASPFALRQEQQATLHQVRLYGLFNHPSGFFCGAESLWSGQVNAKDSSTLADDDFWQFNLYGGYRWWQRRAEVQVALLNLTDQDYRLNPMNSTASLPRERTLTLSFRFSF